MYVPIRHTDSRPAIVLGGRWFPGVHRKASVDTHHGDGLTTWTLDGSHDGRDFDIHVVARTGEPFPADETSKVVGTACLQAFTGLSPGHDGALQAVHMRPDHHDGQPVAIEELQSSFLASFTTARPAPSFVMQDVGVTWTPA